MGLALYVLAATVIQSQMYWSHPLEMMSHDKRGEGYPNRSHISLSTWDKLL